MNIDYKQAAALLGGWDHILILTHRRPDGDTIGCAVGLCALLRQLQDRLAPPQRGHDRAVYPLSGGLYLPGGVCV